MSADFPLVLLGRWLEAVDLEGGTPEAEPTFRG